MVLIRFLGVVISTPLATALVLACGAGPDDPEGAASAGKASEAVPISGTYEVSGTTYDKATGSQRGISGTVILHAEGEAYTSTFNLSTTLLAQGEPQRAELIGHGEGSVSGRVLEGTAETQMIIALVPGVDAGFAYLPRAITTRITNRAKATIAADGNVRIEIESAPAPGEENYSPTRTTLRGRRITAIGIGVADTTGAEDG